ncbi:hypothetical protein BJX61DRAFT_435586 [Aspergillus egyptiacus]|nr:hypothetical protein BJX61DRAFT_435586 [Aspergillus egyptiacus]
MPKLVCFDIAYPAAATLTQDAQQKLLLMLLSVPQLETLIALQRMPESVYRTTFKDRVLFSIPTREPPPALKEARCTQLRNLVLHWDGLSLPWLATLLRPPRSLEQLSLILSLNYKYNRRPPEVALDSALETVSGSLKVLDISIPYNSSTPESVGLYFSSRGLTAFTALRDLYIPEAFLTEGHGFNDTRPWFPASLVSLGLSNAWPSTHARSFGEFDRVAVAVPFEHRVDSEKVDAITRGALARIAWILESLPGFTTIHVP